jgi:hypothetical protein
MREGRVIKLRGCGWYKDNSSWEVSHCPVPEDERVVKLWNKVKTRKEITEIRRNVTQKSTYLIQIAAEA